MPETSPTTPDAAGVTRTPTGEIADQSPTGTPAPTETIVRPPPTTIQSKETPTKSESKADGKTADSGKSLLNEKSEEAKGAPEKYTDFTAPEGFVLDQDVVKEASALFKKHNLSQGQSQELVDFYIKQTKEAFEAPFNAYVDKRQEWRDTINADPEIGGSKLNGVKVSIGKLIDSFGDAATAEAFREAMDYTGAGDNPAVVRGLYALAKRLTEGGPVRGGGPSTEGQRAPGEGRPSAAQAIFPNLPSSSRG
jgi:hypothetical protein